MGNITDVKQILQLAIDAEISQKHIVTLYGHYINIHLL